MPSLNEPLPSNQKSRAADTGGLLVSHGWLLEISEDLESLHGRIEVYDMLEAVVVREKGDENSVHGEGSEFYAESAAKSLVFPFSPIKVAQIKPKSHNNAAWNRSPIRSGTLS